MNKWEYSTIFACMMYAGDDGNIWVRKYPNVKLGWGGWGGLGHLDEHPDGWYYCHTFTTVNNDWAHIPNVTTEEEACTVALMLARMT